MAVALLLAAQRPRLSPGPNSPSARKMLSPVRNLCTIIHGLLVRCDIPIDHNETAHVRRGRKPLVASRHDKSDDPLKKNSESEGVTRT